MISTLLIIILSYDFYIKKCFESINLCTRKIFFKFTNTSFRWSILFWFLNVFLLNQILQSHTTIVVTLATERRHHGVSRWMKMSYGNCAIFPNAVSIMILLLVIKTCTERMMSMSLVKDSANRWHVCIGQQYQLPLVQFDFFFWLKIPVLDSLYSLRG